MSPEKGKPRQQALKEFLRSIKMDEAVMVVPCSTLPSWDEWGQAFNLSI